MSLKLSRAERSAIYQGDYTALKRDSKPCVEAGQTLVLAWSKDGPQFLERDEDKRKREKRSEIVVEIPRRPTLWIEFSEPYEKEKTWVIEFICHDEREPIRLLGAATPTEAGTWTSEAARGYTSGGPVIDHLEAVDDAILAEYAADARERFERERQVQMKEQEQKRLGNKLRRLEREAIKKGVDLTPQISEWVAKAREEIVKQKT